MIKRPILRYHGGKWRLAPWIISKFPTHRVFTESFGGAASVLLRKERSYAEVYNDLDGDIVNLFLVVRDNGYQLVELLKNTPFSRKEFELSYKISEDRIERARRTVVRSFMGFGSASVMFNNSGFRSNSNRSGTTPAHDWVNYPNALSMIVERLRGVVIENRDAMKIMSIHDRMDTLHYVDPPYVHSTRYNRANGNTYNFEMDEGQHERLLFFLKRLKGKVCLSGYDNDLYNDLLSGWKVVKKDAYADGAKKRTEILWMNY